MRAAPATICRGGVALPHEARGVARRGPDEPPQPDRRPEDEARGARLVPARLRIATSFVARSPQGMQRGIPFPFFFLLLFPRVICRLPSVFPGRERRQG